MGEIGLVFYTTGIGWVWVGYILLLKIIGMVFVPSNRTDDFINIK